MDYEKGESSKASSVSKVSSSVVRLTYYPGDAGLDRCNTNGTIFSCVPHEDNALFVCYILTSADLFRPRKRYLPVKEKEVSPVSKIDVCLPTDQLYEGDVVACDMEINVSVIKIKSDAPLPTATLTPFTDCLSVSPVGASESYIPFCQSPYPTKLYPGDEVAVVCRAFGKSCDVLATSGIYSVNYIGCGLDIMPFLRIDCQRIINGAPVINCEGDVIGVAFNVNDNVAFLPANVFFKWWKQVLTYGEIRRPWMGARIINLFAASIGFLENVVHDCDISDGVFVEEVIHGSPAESANMCSRDVICQCDGRPVRSFLEFTELLWDNIGEFIEVKGVRDGCHFGWKVEIKTIKTEILPESLAEYAATKYTNTGSLPESLAENVVTRKKFREGEVIKKKIKRTAKKDKEVTGPKAKTRKREGKIDEKKGRKNRRELDERTKKRWDLSKCSNT